MILKATKVDGILHGRSEEDASATRYDRMAYLQALEQGLKVMDATAISL